MSFERKQERDLRSVEKIDQFLNALGNQIHTELEAEVIKMELYDHISSAIEEYIEADYSEFEAVSKSLKAMGDPREIGYAFNNYDLMKKRKFLLHFFKGLSLALFIGLVGVVQYKAIQVGDTDSYNMIFTVIMYLSIFRSFFYMKLDRSAKYLDIDSKPLFIIWPVKKPIELEYMLLTFIFSPMVLVVVLSVLYDAAVANTLTYSLICLAVFLMSVSLFFYGEKFRIPKYVVVADGLIIRGKFLSWTAIHSFKFENYKSKNKVYYKLHLCSNANTMTSSKIIISDTQKPFITKLLSERLL